MWWRAPPQNFMAPGMTDWDVCCRTQYPTSLPQHNNTIRATVEKGSSTNTTKCMKPEVPAGKPILALSPAVRHSVWLLLLYGALDSHPFFPSHVASGCCFLSAAAAVALAAPPPRPPHATERRSTAWGVTGYCAVQQVSSATPSVWACLSVKVVCVECAGQGCSFIFGVCVEGGVYSQRPFAGVLMQTQGGGGGGGASHAMPPSPGPMNHNETSTRGRSTRAMRGWDGTATALRVTVTPAETAGYTNPHQTSMSRPENWTELVHSGDWVDFEHKTFFLAV